MSRRVLALTAVAALAFAVVPAASASANGTIAECLADNVGIDNIVCHEVNKLPGTPTNGQVQMSWQMVPGTLTTLTGGLWMVRSPIQGQRTGQQVEYPNPDSRTTCSNGNPAGFIGCAKTFSGPTGSLIIDFPVSMAGYQYILTASESLTNLEGNVGGADLYDNGVKTVVWLNKAFRYTVNGKEVVKRTCPIRYKKKCKPAVMLELNTDVGTGMPVSPVN